MSKIIGLDYGHGGADPGAIGNGLLEKDLTLQIGSKIKAILESSGVKVVTSRDNDKYLSLTERANIANKANVDIFASIHINSFSKESANGVETFSHTGSKEGARIAKLVQEELMHAKLFRSNRGIKTANFTVLAKTKAPAVLTELGFISNKEDSVIMTTKQNELALAVAKGLLRAVGINYREPVNKPSAPNSKGDMFRVITGSFEERKYAEQRIKDLKKAGFDSFIDIK